MASPKKCRNPGCFFFGNSDTDDYCSVCYKKLKKPETSPPSEPKSGETKPESSSVTTPATNDKTTKANEPQNESIKTQSAEKPTNDLPEPLTNTETETDTSDGGNSTGQQPAKKKKNRCGVCNKKVGLTGFECRCGGLFCAEHRYSDKHNCSFNYRALGTEEIRKNNPLVTGEKIKKI